MELEISRSGAWLGVLALLAYLYSKDMQHIAGINDEDRILAIAWVGSSATPRVEGGSQNGSLRRSPPGDPQAHVYSVTAFDDAGDESAPAGPAPVHISSSGSALVVLEAPAAAVEEHLGLVEALEVVLDGAFRAVLGVKVPLERTDHQAFSGSTVMSNPRQIVRRAPGRG